MAGFCGWLFDRGEPDAGGVTLDRMAGRLGRAGAPRRFLSGRAALAVANARAGEDERSLRAWAGSLEADSAALESDPSALLSRLRGDGPLVLFDKAKGDLLLATDRFGVHPVYFRRVGTGVLFATKLESLQAHPEVPREIDPQSIFNYIYFHMVPGPRGVFRGVERLEPGEYVLFQRGGSRRGRYWTPRYEETARASISELAEEYRARIRAAVRSCLASANGKIGAFLSGGTDSSTIVGVLREIAGEPPDAYSIGFAIEGFDESNYAGIAAAHFGARHHTYQVTPKDLEASLPLIAEAYDAPFGNASAVASYHCALLARSDGIGTLLGGDGGDEIFAGNSRYAKQAVFEYYLRLPAALRKSLVEPILGALPANGFLPLRPLSKARSFIRQANIPLPDRLEEYNFVTRMTPEAIFTGDFLSSVRPEEPLQLLRDSYAEADTRSTLNRLLYMDLKFTLADNDLRKVGGTCELADVDVLYPFLDPDLVEFANRLPPGLKLKGRKLRYFFKHASRGFLPDAILTKQKHGFGVPCGRWMRDHPPLRDLAYDSLRSLEKRGYLRSEFVSRLMALHQGDHPDYYGVMVYVLTMLELWHRKHAP